MTLISFFDILQVFRHHRMPNFMVCPPSLKIHLAMMAKPLSFSLQSNMNRTLTVVEVMPKFSHQAWNRKTCTEILHTSSCLVGGHD